MKNSVLLPSLTKLVVYVSRTHVWKKLIETFIELESDPFHDPCHTYGWPRVLFYCFFSITSLYFGRISDLNRLLDYS